MGTVTAHGHGRRAREAVLHFVVAALSAVLALAVAGLVVVEVQPGWLAGLRNPARSPAPGLRAPTARRAAAGPTSSTTPPQGTVGGPYLSAVVPADGGAGTTVTISGTRLFSADGTILVTFGGRAAPTRCSSERRCLVTVPAGPRPGDTTAVRMHTSAGLSNALAFRYR